MSARQGVKITKNIKETLALWLGIAAGPHPFDYKEHIGSWAGVVRGHEEKPSDVEDWEVTRDDLLRDL